jgi:hypothetical protein
MFSPYRFVTVFTMLWAGSSRTARHRLTAILSTARSCRTRASPSRRETRFRCSSGWTRTTKTRLRRFQTDDGSARQGQ